MGKGCARCQKLEHMIMDVVKDLELDAVVEKVDDFQKMTEYGVMQTPALVIDEKLILSGRVPDLPELKELLSKLS